MQAQIRLAVEAFQLVDLDGDAAKLRPELFKRRVVCRHSQNVTFGNERLDAKAQTRILK